MQGRLDQLRYPLIVDGARRARTNIVIQAGDTALNEASAPLAYRRLGELSRCAMALLGSPSALLKMMRARLLNAAGNERLRAKDNNCARSLSLSTNSAFGLPVLIAVSSFPRYRSGMQD